MRTANVCGQRQAAAPQTTGECPGCKAPVRAKCGDVNAWHFAHINRSDCDWFPGETPWHLNWKSAAPPDRQEVIIGNNRADIVSPSGVVIELQHSHLPKTNIEQRELAYGRMVWLFDVIEPFEQGRLQLRRHPDQFDDDLYRRGRWEQASKFPRQVKAQLFMDLGKELLWVGGINPDTTLGFSGWLVSHDWFKRVVINGPHLPTTPRNGRKLTVEQMEREIADPDLTKPAPLNWHGHKVGDRLPCRICRQGAFCRDEDGRPCHMVCASEEIGAAA